MKNVSNPGFARPRRIAATACLTMLLCVAATPPGGGVPPGNGSVCPHQGIKEVPTAIQYGPTQSCGTGLSVKVNGLGVHDPKTSCPTFAIVVPAHHIPTPKAGHFTNPAGKTPILYVTFGCSRSWFLFIPLGTTCSLISTKTSGFIQNYVERQCAGERRDRHAGRGTLPEEK